MVLEQLAKASLPQGPWKDGWIDSCQIVEYFPRFKPTVKSTALLIRLCSWSSGVPEGSRGKQSTEVGFHVHLCTRTKRGLRPRLSSTERQRFKASLPRLMGGLVLVKVEVHRGVGGGGGGWGEGISGGTSHADVTPGAWPV